MNGYTQTDDVLAHHAANVAAVAIPVGSIVFNLPEIVTVAVGVMGFIWYAILIGEKLYKWRKAWEKNNPHG